MRHTLLTSPVFFAPLIPEVLKDHNLSAFDRALLSVIIQLAKKKGYCFATNKHLATIFNCSVGSVSKSINKMHKIGYIVHNDPNPLDGGRVFHRTIRKDLFFKPKPKSDLPDKEYKYWFDDDFSDV